jgi:hypothetical protein
MRSADALTSAPSFGGSHGNKNARFAILDCHLMRTGLTTVSHRSEASMLNL